MTAETGYRPVPWHWQPGDTRDQMPPVDMAEQAAIRVCDGFWRSWWCTRPEGHDGTCRAGARGRVYAEWYRPLTEQADTPGRNHA